METHKYEFGKYKTGLYIDINGSGEAYNLLLLVEAHSKRSKRGLLKVSNKPFNESIRIDHIEGTSDRKHWHIEDYIERGFETGHVSIPFTRYTAKTLYIKVLPNQKTGSADR